MSEVKITHGFVTTLPKENARDGIARSVDIALSNEGNYYVTIITQWPNEAEPLKTNIILSPEGLGLLTDALVQASHNMNQYPIQES